MLKITCFSTRNRNN